MLNGHSVMAGLQMPGLKRLDKKKPCKNETSWAWPNEVMLLTGPTAKA